MSRESKRLNIVCLYCNPKRDGFVHGCLDHIASRLEARGADLDRVRLTDFEISHCRGCFNCLRTGSCLIKDDMCGIIDRIRKADGMVIGASVRNGFFPALFKQFYERITYILGFGRILEDKYVLAVGAVGFAEGKRQLKRAITFATFHPHVTDYLFFRVGVPTRYKVEDAFPVLERASDRLYDLAHAKAPPPWTNRLLRYIDNYTIRKMMLERDSEGFYDYVKAQWRSKGFL